MPFCFAGHFVACGRLPPCGLETGSNRGIFMKKAFLCLIFLSFGWSFLFLVSCDSAKSYVHSINFKNCFMDYAERAELTQALNEISAKSPSTSVMVAQGCLNYQSGHYSLAEEHLKKAFQESEEGSETKNLSASILSLIYLKERQKQSIKPYISSASQNDFGRWMLALYHIDNYRETGKVQDLQRAIAQIQVKHNVEGETSASERLLHHMLFIQEMEGLCGSSAEEEREANALTQVALDQGASPAGSPSGQSPCERADLEDEKRYLFSTAHGFLSMLVKAPPFNQLRPLSESEDKSASSQAI